MNSHPEKRRLVKPQPFLKSNGKWVIAFAEGALPPNPAFIFGRATLDGVQATLGGLQPGEYKSKEVEFESKESAEQFIKDNPDRWNALLFGISPDTEGQK